MYIIPMFSILIFCFYLCHQCYSAENKHHHTNDSDIHAIKSHWLIEDNQIMNESFKSLSELKNLHHYMNTFGKDICHGWDNNKEVKSSLLILVDSNTKHEFQRKIARATWLRNFHGSQSRVHVVFFVGKPHSLNTAEHLLMENRKHGDIVWTHVPEKSDYIRSLKMVSGLNWVVKKCKNAKFVLKVDDKTIVNMPALLRFIDKQNNPKNTIWGFKHSISPIKTNKKYIDYTCEHAYLMTHDAAENLYSGALENIPYLSDENQFLTGVVATNQDVNVIHDKHFKAATLSSLLPNNSSAVEKCDYLKNHFIFLKPENRDEWSHILSSFKICKILYTYTAPGLTINRQPNVHDKEYVVGKKRKYEIVESDTV